MIDANEAMMIRSRQFDELVAFHIEKSNRLFSATWEEPIAGGFTNDDYDTRIGYIVAMLVQRGFKVDKKVFNQNSIYEKTIITFSWD